MKLWRLCDFSHDTREKGCTQSVRSTPASMPHQATTQRRSRRHSTAHARHLDKTYVHERTWPVTQWQPMPYGRKRKGPNAKERTTHTVLFATARRKTPTTNRAPARTTVTLDSGEVVDEVSGGRSSMAPARYGSSDDDELEMPGGVFGFASPMEADEYDSKRY